MPRIAVVATRLGTIVDSMVKFVEENAKNYGFEISGIYRVASLLGIPILVKRILERNRDNIDGVVVIGAIVKGTQLDEYVFNQVISKLLDLSIEYEKPIGFSISAPGIYWNNKLMEAGSEAYASISLEEIKKVLEALKMYEK
ncbi:MAG: 6,7-dimethyl-8-ribityllumazine synthase [Ignisphaera sp.]